MLDSTEHLARKVTLLHDLAQHLDSELPTREGQLVMGLCKPLYVRAASLNDDSTQNVKLPRRALSLSRHGRQLCR